MTTRAEMSCQELVELITAYLEGVLPAEDKTRFDDHLMGCIGCREYLTQMRQVVRALGRLTEDDLPDRAKQDLLMAFRDWKKRQA